MASAPVGFISRVARIFPLNHWRRSFRFLFAAMSCGGTLEAPASAQCALRAQSVNRTGSESGRKCSRNSLDPYTETRREVVNTACDEILAGIERIAATILAPEDFAEAVPVRRESCFGLKRTAHVRARDSGQGASSAGD